MTSTESAELRDSTAPDPDGRLAALEAGLAAVVQRLEQDAARAAARERVIDRQHAEIERLRAAERGGLLRPVVTDLYRLRNDLLRQAARPAAAVPGEQLQALLRSYADDLTDALERCGVGVLPDPAAGPVEPGRHQVAGTVPTSDPGRDGTVAEVLADGYLETDTGRVLVPARVSVYRCEGERHD